MPKLNDDMTVIGKWPPKMLKALAAIMYKLHSTYDKQPGVTPGYSHHTCVLTSLAIRDFLVEIGFEDATGRSVATVMRSDDANGKQLHSVGIGVPGQKQYEGKFNGHLVCTVPSLGLLIDATLGQAMRPAWQGILTPIFVTPYEEPKPDDPRMYDRPVITGHHTTADDGRVFTIIWLDRPEVKWKRGTDFIRNDRRRAMTRALVEAFGQWQD